MPMQFKSFRISLSGGEEVEAALNRFLSGHRVLSVERALVQDGSSSCWAVLVEHHVSSATGDAFAKTGGKGRIDYREVLSEEDFRVYCRLREVRKRLSEKDGVPAYTIFTNEQMASLVRGRAASVTDLQKVSGVGVAKARKYGEAFVEVLSDAWNTGDDRTDRGSGEPAPGVSPGGQGKVEPSNGGAVPS